MGTSRCLATSIPLAALACLGAWTATAFGQATPPLPTVSVPLPPVPPVTVTLPPVPPVPSVPAPPVSPPAVPAPDLPVAAPAVPAPRAPAVPVAGPNPASSAAPSAVAALPGVGGSAPVSAAGTGGPAGESSGAPSPSAGPSAAGGADPAEEKMLVQRRDAAARRVRGTRNVRPVPARFSNRGSARGSTVLVFWLARPGRVVFTVLGEAPACRALGSFAARGRAGVNRIRYRGRLDGRPLPPGRYTLVPRVYRRGSVTRLETVSIEILRANARAPLWRRTALVPVECRGDALAGTWESAGAARGRFAAPATASREIPPAGVKAAHTTLSPAAPAADAPSERHGGALEVPFSTDGAGVPLAFLAGVLLTALVLAVMAEIVRWVRFPLATWGAVAASHVTLGREFGGARMRRFLRDWNFGALDAATYVLAVAAAVGIGIVIGYMVGR